MKAILSQDKSLQEKYKQQLLHGEELATLSADKLKVIDARFLSLLKVLLTVGATISSQKDFRDFFVSIASEGGEVLGKMELNQRELELLFKATVTSFNAIVTSIATSKRHQERYTKTWQRFIDGVKACVLHMLTKKVW